jgi:hypothetical protein
VVRPITLERRRLASEQKAVEARRLELHKVRSCYLRVVAAFFLSPHFD